jgi:hypothetical protein
MTRAATKKIVGLAIASQTAEDLGMRIIRAARSRAVVRPPVTRAMMNAAIMGPSNPRKCVGPPGALPTRCPVRAIGSQSAHESA